ncbi:hypothetical protein Xcel_1941 [Xylanimonas cellulosilytica DSM 15894]|uniref:Uncharacterized protein n=1 Tax=Xylanimonas cellulosilytica (strain DSM 15894 / JCM 12276 / CECT 5975 / KCTC 9989 / LMG 20990 / NBRC 107835 / XIL07) TaxID=446471 RepID=D1BTI1_XYLCX|nr:hypothetical protein [Xylanimonas cellulosilytica]ACZ30960.1 hypothetical protein Xcel_1941 [Xylanimonas cellulosilytica DSM 15894]
MHQLWTFTVPRTGLSAADAARASHVVASLPAPAVVTDIAGLLWLVDVHDPQVAEDVAGALRESRLAVTAGVQTVYDAEDRAAADFIGISGADVDLRLVRDGEVFSPDPPCPRCGYHDAFDVVRNGPLWIDESVLGDTEVANLPNGQLLMTRELTVRLERVPARGLVVEDVLSGRRRISDRFVAVRAEVSVPAPCPVHTTTLGDGYCSLCGAAHGALEGHFWLPRSAVGEVDVVSRHPHKAAMLLMRRSVLDAVGDARGLRRGDPAMVCPD